MVIELCQEERGVISFIFTQLTKCVHLFVQTAPTFYSLLSIYLGLRSLKVYTIDFSILP